MKAALQQIAPTSEKTMVPYLKTGNKARLLRTVARPQRRIHEKKYPPANTFFLVHMDSAPEEYVMEGYSPFY